MSTQVERLVQQQQQHLQRAQLLIDTAKREQRALSPDEEKNLDDNMAAVAALDKRITQLASDDALINRVNGITGGKRHQAANGGTGW
jgi:hypothetical protein